MEKLGLIDQVNYKLDQYQLVSLIMGGTSILAPARAGDALDARQLAGHFAARLEKVPLLRQKFVQDPLRLGTMRRVEDPDFDVWDHVSIEKVAAPGGYDEMVDAISRHIAEPVGLDLLWELTLFDGLADGRLASVLRIHHALADGLSAGKALATLNDLQPVPLERPARGPRVTEGKVPGSLALLRHAVSESADRLLVKMPRFLLRHAVPLAAVFGKKAVQSVTSGDLLAAVAKMGAGNYTSLNEGPDSGRRGFAYKTLSLAEIKALSQQFDCTVNDLALLLYSCALQNYFEGIGEEVNFDLNCAMPISTRKDDTTGPANQFTGAVISLHNTVADLTRRLELISRDSQEIKHSARPEKPLFDLAELSELVFPLALDGLLVLVRGISGLGLPLGRMAGIHAALSNVPGSRVQTYVGNAVAEQGIPLIPGFFPLLAVSAGVTSTGDKLTFGFHYDAERVRAPALLVEGIGRGLAELKAVAARADKTAARSSPKQAPGEKAVRNSRGKAGPKRKAGAAVKAKRSTTARVDTAVKAKAKVGRASTAVKR